MDKELLLEIKNYIEASEEAIEGEWGSCRSLEGLIKAGVMPELYTKICELLESK